MKLDTLHPSPENEQARISELKYLLQQPSYKDARPCHGCKKPCPCSHSSSCTCLCDPACSHAPFAMSVDPTRFPIESKIVGLVFGLNSLRVLPPYWSCEGHLLPNGGIHRVPQVWFYSRSNIYPKLIAEYIHQLGIDKIIHYPWHVCLAYTDNNLETGFSIEPDIKFIEAPELHVMQQDAQNIAANMLVGIRSIAHSYIYNYESRANKI